MKNKHIYLFILLFSFVYPVSAKYAKIHTIVIEVDPPFCFSSEILIFPKENKLIFYKSSNLNYHIGRRKNDTLKVYDDVKDYQVYSFYQLNKSEVKSLLKLFERFEEKDFLDVEDVEITAKGDSLTLDTFDSMSMDVSIFFDDNSFKQFPLSVVVSDKQFLFAEMVLKLCEKHEINIYKKKYFDIMRFRFGDFVPIPEVKGHVTTSKFFFMKK